MELSNLTSTLRIKLNTIRSTMGETEVIVIMISFSQLDKGFIFNPEIPKSRNWGTLNTGISIVKMRPGSRFCL